MSHSVKAYNRKGEKIIFFHWEDVLKDGLIIRRKDSPHSHKNRVKELLKKIYLQIEELGEYEASKLGDYPLYSNL